MAVTYSTIESILKERFANDFCHCLNHLPPPHLLNGLVEACKFLKQAIKDKKKIVVFGDYDVDGVISCTIVADFFKAINTPLEVIIPSRFSDGYGLSAQSVKNLDCEVLITVDNGITSFEAAQECKERNITLIITDHHTPKDTLPDAPFIINPKLSPNFPQQEICGACVAWYLCAGLKKEMGIAYDMKSLLDLLACATIADVMPMHNINYVVVKKGLEVLKHSTRPSMIALREYCKKTQITSETLGFHFSPLLNCAGRMREAKLAFNFLNSATLKEANTLLSQLIELNVERKQTQKQILQEAKQQIKADDSCIVVFHPTWHEGVLGIIASQLVEIYHKPAIVLSAKGDLLQGSARTFGECDILSLLQENEHLLESFGGHKGAAGLKLKETNLAALKQGLNHSTQKHLSQTHAQTTTKEDDSFLGEVCSSELSLQLLDLIDSFEPYGECNPRPKFSMQAKVMHCKSIGNNGIHTSLSLNTQHTQGIRAIAFNQQYNMPPNTQVCILFSLGRDSFNPQFPQIIIERVLAI